ncbi:hypothetical protein BDW02DRAFT_566058 [Decorospora gaudefroyi]|uniref:Uncharacterized protein n=1 Tax=Decorospora gaudefroyi TaxID=184978 RepID=A0A6A5KNV3_9PLEO|nr:hypothetical protein BDW02DRAFT_566058 [Decorospora gaudefroyi]
MPSDDAPSPLLALPRELRDNILDHLTLSGYVYTSTTTTDTRDLYRGGRATGATYVDTRIWLPCRPPANILATCKQLRDEALEHHVRMLNSLSPTPTPPSEKPLSNVLAERLGAEFAEEAERACDDGTLRITLEVQRQLRGTHGYHVPVREELSPRFLALLPLLSAARKLRLAIWPGYDWWNGGPQPLIDKRGNACINADAASKPNAASFAISTVLQHLPHVRQLTLDVLMEASDVRKWDLPDRKWENVQPWLDSTLTTNVRPILRQINRNMTIFFEASQPEPFYTQHETRLSLENTWKVDRKGDMGTPTMLTVCVEPADIEFLKALVIEESFIRTD